MPNKYNGALSFINDIGSLPSLDDGMPKPDPMNQRIPKAPKQPQETGSGAMDMGPTEQPVYHPDPTEPDDATQWNQEVTRQPVYEYDGMRIVGDLRWAPEWSQDLQPVDWVIVPTPRSEWKQS